MRIKDTLATALLATVLGACATVDFDYPKAASSALLPAETRGTPLGELTGTLCAGKAPEEAGFYALSDAIDALAIRLLLAEHAAATIDAQYYLIKPDEAGLAFVDALLEAADRGVRVRVLVDDMFMSGRDAGLAALDAHPNLEIRVFNPFASRTARFWDGLTSFSRVNRRMHNKSFTVDNQVTVVGGRNIADEYFGSREDARFGDLDVMGIGPVVAEVSESFDTYWNHVRAAPIPAFATAPEDPEAALEDIRQRLRAGREEVAKPVYEEAVLERELAFLEEGSVTWVWAPYTLVADSTDKSFKDQAEDTESIKNKLLESLLSAEEEAILLSPYFVPRQLGMAVLEGLEERGVDVTVITNSLASNNQFTVHAGYAPVRRPLLEHGVELYEVRPDAYFEGQDLIAASGAKSTLHTKAFILDREEVFIGSFNFDPRSAYINTELGVIIHSPVMAQAFADRVRAALPERTWQVFLDERGRTRWRGYDEAGEEYVLRTEPETSCWDRFVVGCVRLLPIRSQL